MTKLLFFKQPSCVPCTMMNNIVSLELNVTPDKTLMLFTGDKESDELALKFGVMTTPTLVLSDDKISEPIRIVRGLNRSEIESIIEEWRA